MDVGFFKEQNALVTLGFQAKDAGSPWSSHDIHQEVSVLSALLRFPVAGV